MDGLDVGGKRKRGRSKLRWNDRIKGDLKERGWCRVEALEIIQCRGKVA